MISNKQLQEQEYTCNSKSKNNIKYKVSKMLINIIATVTLSNNNNNSK